MDKKQRDKISKFLSLVLRHKPEEIGIVLDEEGWADTQELLGKLDITSEELDEVVALNDKQRFVFSADKQKIRANQGHSVTVELKLERVAPPEILYHGTAERNINSIFAEGLLKQQRHHVHLSAATDIARNVGSRYGKPIVLTVLAQDMHKDGYIFYCSENNVWLTDFVPPEFIKLTE